ncbi:hypothetical protein [Bradyrhizobium sp. Tv2a-2]|uniref:hypothetical protein n=1 Tax=Bradyrhizobium sp. Tv2a-2 TaxID=113395 RepID=UPI000406EBF2|nr:hypothetical protein [Bradyrhizobium sp. Tv2a-2]
MSDREQAPAGAHAQQSRLKRPDSIYGRFHLENWTDDDFAKHTAATRKTLAYLIELEDALAHRSPAGTDAVSVELMQRVWANLYFNEEDAGNTFQQTLNEVVDWLAARNALPSGEPHPAASAPEPEDDCSCGGGELSGHDGMCPYAHEPAASAAQEAVAWQWRACISGQWGSWLYLNDPIEKFRQLFAFNLDNGTYEVRPLYAAPSQSQPETDDLAGKLRAAHQDKLKLWEAIAGGPEPRCRDCADFNGRCQGDGLPCEPQERALKRVRLMRDLVEQLTRTLEQAQCCILGDTPEGMSHEDARLDTLEKIRAQISSTDGTRT